MKDKFCDFCGSKGKWKNILRDQVITKKDGSDLILCDSCINHYANGEFDKIKIKDNMSNIKDWNNPRCRTKDLEVARNKR